MNFGHIAPRSLWTRHKSQERRVGKNQMHDYGFLVAAVARAVAAVVFC